jgi:hypothetical protein
LSKLSVSFSFTFLCALDCGYEDGQCSQRISEPCLSLQLCSSLLGAVKSVQIILMHSKCQILL